MWAKLSEFPALSQISYASSSEGLIQESSTESLPHRDHRADRYRYPYQVHHSEQVGERKSETSCKSLRNIAIGEESQRVE